MKLQHGNTIMVSEISIFTKAVENLQFNCDHCNRKNSSQKGLTQHMWLKQCPSNDLRHYHFDYCSQVYKERPEGQEKTCKEGQMKCNMENVPNGHILHSNQIDIWNVNSKHHTTTDHTKAPHEDSSISLFCVGQKSHLQEPHEEPW